MSDTSQPRSSLAGPNANPSFVIALDELISIAKKGHNSTSELFNPGDQWLRDNMRVFQKLEENDRLTLSQEVEEIMKIVSRTK